MTKDELKKEAENNKPPYAFCALNTNCELWKDGYEKGAEPREKRIAELEKENAELKEQISTKDILIKELQEQKVYWKESSFDWRHKFFKLDKVKRLIKKDKQLAKAKDLLKWALLSDPEHDEDFEKKWEEAKQFLNSEVEK